MIGDWLDIGPVTQISPGNARTLPVRSEAAGPVRSEAAGPVRGEAAGPVCGEAEETREIAIFHTLDNRFYALDNRCPHKQGPLSQGILHGDVVTCPLHGWNISLKTGHALGEDRGCVPVIPLRVDAGRIYLLRSAVMGAAPSPPTA